MTYRIADIDEAATLLQERLQHGGNILVPQAASEPTPLVQALSRVSGLSTPATVYVGHGIHEDLAALPEADFRIVALAGAGTTRKLISSGRAEVLPIQWSHLVSDIIAGRLRLDVAIAQLAPSRDGFHSFGVGADLGTLLTRSGATVFAEVNSCMPRVLGEEGVAEADVAYVLETERALPAVALTPPTATERTIGENIASVVKNKAVLQVGIGGVPEAAMEALRDHRGLGIHTGLLGDGLMKLIEAGVVTNEHKTVAPGKSITGAILGTHELYRWVHENQDVWGVGLELTHGPSKLSQLSTLTAVNSAVEVDLTGQVNAESVGPRRYMGAVGGQVDFLRAAVRAPDGLSIIALPSRTPKGQSKIVPRLHGGVVTSLRTDVDMVVSEFGVADLRWASLEQRQRRLISIAHPEDREILHRNT